MNSHLEAILARKREEIAALVGRPVLPRQMTESFAQGLCAEGLSVIAEIKRRSPSRGELAVIDDPVVVAAQYIDGGAAAISVLTDAAFGGSLDDLKQVAIADGVPVLRKDFILSPLQIDEAVAAGAAAVLLIVAAVEDDLDMLLEHADEMGIETLVEVHDLVELERALEAGATIIGVNNRDLHTFEVNLQVAEQLRSHIPADLIAVAESGIHGPEDAVRMRAAGYDAVLVGEALVQEPDPAALIGRIRQCS